MQVGPVARQQASSVRRPAARSPVVPLLSSAFGFSRLIVELGVLSSLVFSLALFIAALAQAYRTIGQAMQHLGDPSTTKTLLVAAVEQADTLLVGVALLIISMGLQSLFVGRLRNVPQWLHVDSFGDLKQKLLGVVVTALAVHFFAVALEWDGGTSILAYGGGIAAVMLAIGVYSVVLERIHGSPAQGEPGTPHGGPEGADVASHS